MAGQPWSTNGTTGDQWDVRAMGVAFATATHWVAVLSAQNAQVLNGSTGDKCDAQIVSSTVRPIAGSCQSAATSSQNFTWQAAAY